MSSSRSKREREPSREGQLSRRQFVLGAGAVAAGGSLVAVSAAAEDVPDLPPGALPEDERWRAGIVERVESADAFYLRSGALAESVRVQLSTGAEVLRDGTVDLRSFQIGDAVAVQAQPQDDGTLLATAVESQYRILAARLTGRQGDELESDQGEIVLTAKTVARDGEAIGRKLRAKPLERLGKGGYGRSPGSR